jgi:hypothetical protein
MAFPAISVAVAIGCGGGGTTVSAQTGSYLGTQTPGDVWTYSLQPGAFTATDETTGTSYTGTCAVEASGFLQLTVTQTNDPSVQAGDSAYAIEIPGTALIIDPAGTSGSPVIACKVGVAAANGATLSYNWVRVPPAGWTTADPAYGTITFHVDGDSYDGDISNYLVNGTADGEDAKTFTYSNGSFSVASGGKTENGALTPSGTFVIDEGAGQGGIVGIQQPRSSVDLTDLCSTSRHFSGILMNKFGGGDSGGKTECIWAVGLGGTSVQGGGYADIVSGTHEAGESGVVVDLNSQPTPGLVQATITTNGPGNPSYQMVVAVSKVNGKYVLYAFGSDNSGYNVVLIEQ